MLALAITLAAVTGARRGELCALRWSDVNSDKRPLTIARSLTEIEGLTTEGPTKTHQRRDIALDETLLPLLQSRRAAQVAYAADVGTKLVVNATPEGIGVRTMTVPPRTKTC